MGNRKGISSEDFMFDDSKNAEVSSKFTELNNQGATAISSDMMFGRASGPEKPQPSLMEAWQDNLMGRSSNGSYDEYKEAATKVAERVGAKASEMKAATMDWFSQFTAPQ